MDHLQELAHCVAVVVVGHDRPFLERAAVLLPPPHNKANAGQRCLVVDKLQPAKYSVWRAARDSPGRDGDVHDAVKETQAVLQRSVGTRQDSYDKDAVIVIVVTLVG